jgi:hypothetical protein
MKSRSWFAAPSIALLASSLAIIAVFAAPAAQGRTIALSGTSSPQTGAFSPWDGTAGAEFPGQVDTKDGPGPFPGSITNRSLSKGNGKGPSVTGSKKAKSNPVFDVGFDGLNIYQQRYARGGNQFTVEPPDQALCVGNGYIVEAVNDVMNVYDSNGTSLLPDNTAANIVAGHPRNVNHAVDLNSFYGYAPAINRTTGVRAQFVTDPSCLYDAATQRFFVVVLTLESFPNGAFTHQNHLDIAVSATSNPTGTWNIYRIDVTGDGTNNPAASNACPCLGDYPHIGADANGFYVTTNAYPWGGNGFNGAQIYAFSKAQLAAGAASVTMVHIDTFGAVNAPSDAGSTQPGFTVWPAQSPDGNGDGGHGGTEFFLSSNAADEAKFPVAGTGGDYTSSQIVLWTLTNTSSLDSATPALGLSAQLIDVGQYAIPPKFKQLGSGTAPTVDTPQGHCINDTTTVTIAGTGCWRLLFVGQPAHNEVISRPDSNDTRMQQVVFANGKLWGALDTAINPDALGPQRAGITYFIVNPNSGKLDLQGYLGATGYDFTYPAIGVTNSGRGVITFTASGDTTFPGAAMASLDAKIGAGPWSFAGGPDGEGAATDDGFTSYKAQVGNPPRTRWGDYGAVAVDGNSIWIASEFIADPCDYTTWGGPFFVGGTGDNLLGTCAGTSHGPGLRTSIANWATRITKFTLK